jgi:hypothetical protein
MSGSEINTRIKTRFCVPYRTGIRNVKNAEDVATRTSQCPCGKFSVTVLAKKSGGKIIIMLVV